ncbi:helix-turn-helix domain-containing protein [Nocardia harenae]|uniref:helix-turn-helix domain-containing protein n=1 Tax=Nocardia harenae TaxID=358707 RepID=UPI000AB54ECD|nr:helix-turn-helix transcriptional regulator [Nocardia harenae]
MDRTFGQELRRLRLRRSLSLGELAELVHYSKGHLSKIENGRVTPIAPLARACDSALSADGRLIALAATDTRPGPPPELPADTAWTQHLHPDGSGIIEISGSPGPPIVTYPAVAGFATDPIAGLAAVFDELRRLGRSTSPSMVLPMVAAQNHVATAAARRGSAGNRPLLLHAARTAEFAGWMAQECGNDIGAAWWTERAVDQAASAGDTSMASYALVRRAVLSLYRADSSATTGLTEQVLGDSAIDPRIRWLAALGAAQGYAIGADAANTMRALERAGELWDHVHRAGTDDPLGPAALHGRSLLIEAWCHYDLGNLEAAARLFASGMSAASGQSDRDRARFGTRQALVHAAMGDVDRACELIEPLLDVVRAVDSVTVRLDLHDFARTVGRFPDHPVVHRISTPLRDALNRR